MDLLDIIQRRFEDKQTREEDFYIMSLISSIREEVLTIKPYLYRIVYLWDIGLFEDVDYPFILFAVSINDEVITGIPFNFDSNGQIKIDYDFFKDIDDMEIAKEFAFPISHKIKKLNSISASLEDLKSKAVSKFLDLFPKMKTETLEFDVTHRDVVEYPYMLYLDNDDLLALPFSYRKGKVEFDPEFLKEIDDGRNG